MRKWQLANEHRSRSNKFRRQCRCLSVHTPRCSSLCDVYYQWGRCYFFPNLGIFFSWLGNIFCQA
jgi:hypothetical protein